MCIASPSRRPSKPPGARRKSSTPRSQPEITSNLTQHLQPFCRPSKRPPHPSLLISSPQNIADIALVAISVSTSSIPCPPTRSLPQLYWGRLFGKFGVSTITLYTSLTPSHDTPSLSRILPSSQLAGLLCSTSSFPLKVTCHFDIRTQCLQLSPSLHSSRRP